MIENISKIISEVGLQHDGITYIAEQMQDIVDRFGVDAISSDVRYLPMLLCADEYKRHALLVDKSAEGELRLVVDEDGNVITTEVTGEKPVSFMTEEDKSSEISDYRFQEMSLVNFRKFPTPTDKNRTFGLQFSHNGVPYSTILCGANGCGKSSIYRAMEYAFFGVSDDMKNKEEAIPFGKLSMDAVQVSIVTGRGVQLCSDSESKIDLPNPNMLKSFFCNESNISTALNYDLDRLNAYIYKQLGYGPALDFIAKLKEEVIEAKESVTTEYEDTDCEKVQAEIIELEGRYDALNTFRDNFFSIMYNLYRNGNNNTDLENVLKNLDREYYFDYNPDRDKAQELQASIKRLNEQAKDLIDKINEDLEEINKNIANFTFLTSRYVSLIERLEKTLIDNVPVSTSIDPVQYCFMQLDDLSLYFERWNRVHGFYLDLALEMIEQVQKAGEGMCTQYMDTKDKELRKIGERKKLLQESLQQNSEYKKNQKRDEDIDKFIKQFESSLNRHLETIVSPISDSVYKFIEAFTFEDEKIERKLENAKLELYYSIGTQENSENVKFAPSEYLNSFRLKMFGISLKIAIAFSIMKDLNIAFPLIFDDIFYANDFNNRENVYEYFKMVNNVYKEHCPNHPDLQIIFLTHDDVIYNSVVAGMASTGGCIHGMLFDYKEVCEEDLVKSEKLSEYYQLYQVL